MQRTTGQLLEREYGKKPEAGAEVVGMTPLWGSIVDGKEVGRDEEELASTR